MILLLKKCPLFAGMSESDIENCLSCSGSKAVSYQKGESIFLQQDAPEKLYILLEGSVSVCSDSVSGKRSIVTTITCPGELFGEVLLFINRTEYFHYAQAAEPVRVLEMPKEFLYHTCGRNCGYHTRLISNMLSILAQKAYYLNRRLQVLSCGTLRQKIACFLLQDTGGAASSMNREELADFLNAARPSLSRELMKMQDEGLLRIDRRSIQLLDKEKLQNIL